MNLTTFCITLPETPGRRAAALKHFDECGALLDLGVRVLNGIHAKSFGLMTCHPYEVDDPGSGFTIPPKHVGLHLSHYMAWTVCRHSEVGSGPPGSSAFIILEDDAQFEAGWQVRLVQALRDVPADADMLFIGSGNTFDKPKAQVKGEVWSVQWPQCTHAYVVWPKALPVLLETQRDTWAPIDLALIFRSFPQLNVYTVLPRIVSQRGQDIAP